MKVRDVIKRLSKMAGVSLEPRAATGNFITQRNQGPLRLLAHPSVDIPPGTLNNIRKQAGLK
jgi:predicted RNA binding protein YcfA (HicA-like mRNA interferase family)